MPWYKTGTVTVTNGSTEVVGSGTTWGDGTITPGDSFSLVDSSGAAVAPFYEVASVTDDTHLTLSNAYGGTTASGVKYALWNLAAEHTTPYLSSLVAALIQRFKLIGTEILGYVTRAETAATNAETAEDNAASSATAAANSASAAQTAKTGAESAKSAAEAAKTAAETAKGQAETSATNAAGSASAAAGSASAAAQSASEAASSAASMTPSTATPLQAADTGSAGTSAQYARGDHVHPRRPEVKVYVDGESDSTIIAATKEGDLVIRMVSVDE